MPDDLNTTDNINPPPPSGDPKQAEKYVDQLINLLESDLLTINHTDLARFDPSSMQDHFNIDLKDYQVEISHSKHPQSSKDSYVMLFTNLKKITDGSEKVILAYMHLGDNQFMYFRKAYSQQVERRRKAEEERRLKEALAPIDKTLEEFSSDQTQNPTSASAALS